MPEQKPFKICRVGGRSFPIFREYDAQLKESYPAYPDFEKQRNIQTTVGPSKQQSRRAAPTGCRTLRESPSPPTAAAAAGFTGRKRPTTPSASVCATRCGVIENETEEFNDEKSTEKLSWYLMSAVFVLSLLPALEPSAGAVWNGTDADTAWYTADTSLDTFTVADAADLAG